MTIWTNEIKELDKIYESFKGHIPDIVKEMEQLIKTDDPNVVMLYSRRCLEVIVTDLCECELKRPRKTEPLKGIIDKLNSEEKVPSHIITSMHSLNSMATYGAHPKDFDPDQVKPVLNNLAIIIKWYLKYKDFKIVSKTEPLEERKERETPEGFKKEVRKPIKKQIRWLIWILAIAVILIVLKFVASLVSVKQLEKALDIAANNQVIKSVTIGTQVWMSENLKTTKLNDGTPIQLIKGNEDWAQLTTPACCWYNNSRAGYQETYGTFYNWFAVNTGKLCPVGWHVPSDSEWKTLTDFLGDSVWFAKQSAGIKLKEAGNEHWKFNDTIYATNEYGFTALPGGLRTIYGAFWGINEMGCWWASTEDDYDKEKFPGTPDAKNREMNLETNGVIEIQQYKQTGMSVRCIKDNQ